MLLEEERKKKKQLIFCWTVVLIEIPADAPRLLTGDHHPSFQPYHLSSSYLEVLECLRKKVTIPVGIFAFWGFRCCLSRFRMPSNNFCLKS